MVNVPEAVRVLSVGVAYPRPRAFVVARTIREQAPLLLPRDPVGRNLSTHLQPSHIINLMIGMAASDPIAKVAEQVRAWRAARWNQPMPEVLGEVPKRAPLLGGQNLGLDLDGLIDFLARSSEKERKMRLVWPGRFRVTLDVGEPLAATVEDRSTGQVDWYDAKGAHTSAGGQTFQLQGKKREVVPLRRVVHLEFAHFELAAELWADSLKHGAVYTPSFLHSSNDETETESAGSPGREPTPSDCQSSTHAADDSGTPLKTSGLDNRRCNSSVCVSSSGKSMRVGAATTNLRRQHAIEAHHHHPA